MVDRVAAPGPAGRLRPEVESFERDGLTLVVVDWPAIAASAHHRVVNLLPAQTFPAPIRRAALTLSARDGWFMLSASIHSGQRESGPYFRALGDGPIGTLLRRRMKAGDERAIRIVGGLQQAVTRLNRSTGQRNEPGREWSVGRPIRSTIVVDDQTGLRTTVIEHATLDETAAGRIVRLEATMAGN